MGWIFRKFYRRWILTNPSAEEGTTAAAEQPRTGLRPVDLGFSSFLLFYEKWKSVAGMLLTSATFFFEKKPFGCNFWHFTFYFSKRGERVFPSEKPFWPSVKISFALNIYALAKTYGFGLCILGLNSFWPKNLRFFGTCARVGLALEGSSRHAPWPGPKDQGKHRP